MRSMADSDIWRRWHGSSGRIEKFKGNALTGTIHLGTLEQAAMRSGGKHLHLVEIRLPNLKRVRDKGHDDPKIISAARRAGYDGLVYLNRYEGISAEKLDEVRAMHPRLDLDRIPDSKFRQLFYPEACDSFLAFDPHHCKLISYFETIKEAEAFMNPKTITPVTEEPGGPWHISIDYDENDPTSYRGVVATRGKEIRRFEGKGPQDDWADYLEWGTSNEIMALTSSSVGHFCWDVPGWRFVLDDNGHERLVVEDRPEYAAEHDQDPLNSPGMS